MAKYLGSLASYPARTVAVGYLLLILVGSVLLWLPFSRVSGREPITILESVFTATSATCVTGLTVRSTGEDFSQLGQILILLLFQVGGIGIMTLTTLATISFGNRESIRQRSMLTETLGLGGLSSWQILRRILLVTLSIELIGAVALFVRLVATTTPVEAGYFAVFHSVSAFCNAGFALHDESLCKYVGDLTVNGTVMALIVLGGLGFPVLEDLIGMAWSPKGFRWDGLRLQSKVVLSTTGTLVGGGALVILLFEWNNGFATLNPLEAVLAALFQSVTTRTAGFNSVPIASLTEATLFVMILLMVVGGSPCSAAGGAKTSTVSLVVLSAWSRIRGRSETTIFKRTLDRDLVSRATALVLLYVTVATIGIALLLTAEARNTAHRAAGSTFMFCVFEAFSALGTVGLSAGETKELSPLGKMVLIVLMYIGRIGPISLALVISRDVRVRRIEYAKEGLLIG